MAALSLPILVLWVMSALFILNSMTLVTDDKQEKTHDRTSLHHLTSFPTSQNARRRILDSAGLRAVEQFHQQQLPGTIVSTASYEKEDEVHGKTHTTMQTFQLIQTMIRKSTLKWEIETKGSDYTFQKAQTFRGSHLPVQQSTTSPNMENKAGLGILETVQPQQPGKIGDGPSAASKMINGAKDGGGSIGRTRSKDQDNVETVDSVKNEEPNFQVSSENVDLRSGQTVTRSKRRIDGDTFPCPPCVCSYMNQNTIANCTGETTHKVPTTFPKDIWGIFLHETNVYILDIADLQYYSSLSILSISSDVRLHTIRNSLQKYLKLPMKEIHLSKCNISTIENGSFRSVPDLLTLNLENNNISVVTKFMFEGLDNLLSLNLSHNRISSIESGAFNHLTSLKAFDLSNNKDLYYYPTSFDPQLFQNLHNVQLLSIKGFHSKGVLWYPNELLEKLSNLQELYIDGLQSKAAFGPGIKKLQNFTTLRMGDSRNCRVTSINSTFFENLPRIKHVSFIRCHHLRLQSNIIPISKHITTLEISSTLDYDLFTALEEMYVFQNSSLTSLALVNLHSSNRASVCRSLRKVHARNLQNLNLEVLDLSENMLAVVGNDFLRALPKSLTKLSLRANRLVFLPFRLDRMSFLNQLTELDVSFQNIHYQYDSLETTGKTCPQKVEFVSQTRGSYHISDYNHTLAKDKGDFAVKSVNRRPQLKYCDTDYNDEEKNNQDTPQLLCKDSSLVNLMPPNLKLIRASHFYSLGLNILSFYRDYEGIKEVYLSNNFLVDLHSKKKFLPNDVEIADLSNNYCGSLNERFFRRNNSVTHLYLHGNLLGLEFASDYAGYYLSKLRLAQYVDISNNFIYSLPFHFFNGLKKVQTLSISNNKLQALNVSLAYMKELRHLNLSHNSISWISKNTLEDLDIIASQHLLTVDLTSNPLPCTCAGLELLYWMSKTNVYFMHQKYLQCRLSNNVLDHIGDFDERVKYLQKHCASNAVIIVICVACFALVAILVGFSLMYRFRWRLRYLRNIAIAKLVGFMPEEEENHDYKFDAYVLFSEDAQAFVIRQCLQELEVKRGHKLCISVRNFMPGAYMVSNIVGAVQHSAKTVVVVTPDLYKEDYAEYTIKMALMEEIYNKRSVLHLCVYQPMPDEEMAQCHDLLMVMKRDDYTEYPPENEVREEIMENFWDRLSQAIGHANHDEVDAEDDE